MINLQVMNTAASNFVQGVDMAFYVILGTSFFFFILIVALMIYFAVRYNRKRHPKAIQIKESSTLEIAWTVVPLILVLLMFYFGYVGYKPMREVPEGAMTVKTIGKMWEWIFVYDSNKHAKELVVPINKPVKLDLVSEDVLHSFYIPAFRVKEDVVPKKTNYVWFIPQQLGEYDILCSEYCGLRHSYMEAKIRVVTEEQYNSWLAALPVKQPEKNTKGLQILKKNNCLACHSLDGQKLVGPSFKGLFGTERDVVTNGASRKVVADENYIETSIYKPNEDVVNGFNAGIMQPYGSVIKKKEIKEIIEFLKQLNEPEKSAADTIAKKDTLKVTK